MNRNLNGHEVLGDLHEFQIFEDGSQTRLSAVYKYLETFVLQNGNYLEAVKIDTPLHSVDHPFASKPVQKFLHIQATWLEDRYTDAALIYAAGHHISLEHVSHIAFHCNKNNWWQLTLYFERGNLGIARIWLKPPMEKA